MPTDLDALSTWLPPGIDVDRCGPDLLRLWSHHGHRTPHRPRLSGLL